MYNHPGTPMGGNTSILLESSFQPENQTDVYLGETTPYYKNKSQIPITKVAPAFPEKFSNGDRIEFTEAFDDPDKLRSTIFDVLRPVFLALRSLGIFPIAYNTQQKIFEVTKPWMAYSVTCLILFFGFTGYLKWNKVQIIKSAEGRFEEAVIDYLFTVYLVPIVINPIALYEAQKQAELLTQMISFESIYMRIARKRLILSLVNKPLIITIALLTLGGATMIITHITMANVVVYQVIPYCYINVITYILGGAWYIYCDVIGNVATVIAQDFQNALKTINTLNKLAEYRALWMMLSKIIRNAGNSFGYALTFLCLYLFFVITLTIYGLLSQIQEGMSIKDIGLAITAVSSVTMLFFICDEAHYASTCVRSYFQKKILLVELSQMSEEAQQEINMFLRATEMNPTDMTLCGFFDVNRNLFKSLLATMVTYLVVLLQFQISIPESSDSSNNATTAAPVKAN